MQEVEVKILEADVGAVERKLRALGAKKTFEGRMEIAYYDFPDKRLKKAKKLLRTRTKGNYTELTFKEKIRKGKAKTNLEHEVQVNDKRALEKILHCMGLQEVKLPGTATVGKTKHRISYSLRGMHFELDTFKGIPTFIEIEGPNLARVQEFVQKLGFEWKDAKPWTGKDVIQHYKKNTRH